jgi:hypothetical protein
LVWSQIRCATLTEENRHRGIRIGCLGNGPKSYEAREENLMAYVTGVINSVRMK